MQLASDDSPQDLALKRLKRFSREDATARRDQRDPEFSSQEIAKMTGYSHSRVIQLLLEAGIGRVRRVLGVNRKMVKWSELKKLAKEMGWFG